MTKYILVPLILFVTACATSQPLPTATSIPPTQMPQPTYTPTPIPPTATSTSIPPTAPPTPTLGPLPGSIPEGIVITFTKKEECTVSGPTELPPGEYTFVLRDLSDTNQRLYLSYYIDGKTNQTVLDKQVVPGRWYPKPDWIVYAKMIEEWRNESRNEKYFTYSLEEGEHGVLLGSSSPISLWVCDPIWVR
ncbi:MAG: hypothetical protein KAI06_01305 [Anaerolineales bacterium]|nr:hypothetical protein [Anaerolineales bacterium]